MTQPINGAKKEGAVGFAKGFLKGALGTGFKPAAGESPVFFQSSLYFSTSVIQLHVLMFRFPYRSCLWDPRIPVRRPQQGDSEVWPWQRQGVHPHLAPGARLRRPEAYFGRGARSHRGALAGTQRVGSCEEVEREGEGEGERQMLDLTGCGGGSRTGTWAWAWGLAYWVIGSWDGEERWE